MSSPLSPRLLPAFMAAGALLAGTAQAQVPTWSPLGTVSGTLAANRICYSDGKDILCDTTAPTLGGVGTADRLTSGTQVAVLNQGTGNISLTTAGTSWGYLAPSGFSYLPYLNTLGVSATGTVSATSGYFASNVGIGTAAPTYPLDVAGTVLLRNGGIGAGAFYAGTGAASRAFLGMDAGDPDRLFRLYSVARNTNLLTADVSNLAVMIGGNAALAGSSLTVVGEAQVGSSGAPCAAANGGAIRYSGGNLSYCNGSAWTALAAASGVQTDRITSGTDAVVVNGGTHTISFTTNGVVTGYSDPLGNHILPGVSATGTVSATSGYFANKVGIGTAAPGKSLDVSGTVRFSSGHIISNHPAGFVLNSGPAAPFYFRTNTVLGDETNYATLMVITPSGSLGLGTASPAASLTIVAGEAQVGNSGAPCVAANAGAIRYSAGSLTYCNGSAWTAMGGAGAAAAASSTGAVQFNAAGSLGGDTANLFWDNANKRLGVGTAAPRSALDVTGTGGLLVTGSTYGVPAGTSAVNLGVAAGSPRVELYHSGDTTPWEIDNDTGNFRIFRPGLVYFQIAASTGNVGVRVGNANYPLTVSGTVSARIPVQAGGWAALNMANPAGATLWNEGLAAVQSGSNAGGDYNLWRYADDGSYLGRPLYIQRSTGNVTMDNALTVGGNLTTGGAFYNNGNMTINNGAPTLSMQDTDNRSAFLHTNSNHFYILRGNGNNAADGAWAQVGGIWPLDIDLETNLATFGGLVANQDWTGTDGGLKIRGTAPTLSLWDTDNARKWMVHTNGDIFYVQRATTQGESATDWVNKFHVDSAGNATASLNIYAQAFSDSNNGAYYVNPDHISLVNQFNIQDARADVYYDRQNLGFYMQPRSVSIFNDIRPSVIYDRDNNGFYLNPDATSVINEMYASIIRDRGNGGYYLQPASTSRFNYTITDRADANIYYDMYDTSFYVQGRGTSRFNRLDFSHGYDIDNGGYYIDLNNTTRMNTVVPDNMWAAARYDDCPGGWTCNLRVAEGLFGSILTTGFSQRSDARLKKDIGPLRDDIVARMMQLNPVSYHWRDPSKSKTIQYGLIAQDVEKVMPELVLTATDASQTKSLNYNGLIAPMLQAIKELKADNDNLRRELDELRREVRARAH